MLQGHKVAVISIAFKPHRDGVNPCNKFQAWYPTDSQGACAIDTTGDDITVKLMAIDNRKSS